MADSLLGKGLAWPLRMDPTTNDFVRVSDESNVEQCVKGLVLTRVGERKDAQIGSVLPEMTFEDVDVAADQVQPSVFDTITRNEPRVRIIKVNVVEQAYAGGATGLLTTLRYVVRATNQRGNAVVPFILEPETP